MILLVNSYFNGDVVKLLFAIILVLIDGSLQFRRKIYMVKKNGHNPCFNRWFFAMT